MRFKKVMKKVAALTTGVTMLGATLLGATADLGDLPAPFVKDGVADFMMYLGDDGATADVIGAIEIGTAWQFAMQQTSLISTGTTVEIGIDEGAKVSTSGEDLYGGTNLSDVKERFSKEQLPVVLADGTAEDEDGDEYDYEQYIYLFDAAVAYGKPGDIEEPTLYLDVGETTGDRDLVYQYRLIFDEAFNVTLAPDEEISMAGLKFTFSNKVSELDGDDFYAFASDVSKVVTVGEVATVNIDGSDVELEVIGANTDNDEATVKVNGVMKQVEEGDDISVSGVDLYIKNIFMQTIPTASAAVEFFVGSEKWRFQNGSELEIDGDSVDGVNVEIRQDAGLDITSIRLNVSISDTDEEWDNGDDRTYIPQGEAVMDPAFGTFEVLYAGPEIAPASEVIFERDGSKKLELTFTSESDVENKLDFVYFNANEELNVSDSSDPIRMTAASTLEKKDYCILSEAKANSGYTHIVRLTDVDDDKHNVEFDIVGAGTKTVSYDDVGLDGTLELDGLTAAFTNVDEANEYVDLDCTNVIYTKGGMKLDVFDQMGWNSSGIWQDDLVTSVTFNVTEDAFDNSEGNQEAKWAIQLNADASDDEIDVASPKGLTLLSVEDQDEEYVLTDYGTEVEYDSENDDYLGMTYPEDVQTHAVFFAPVGATTTETGGAGTVETVTLDRINVGTALLASQAANIASSNVVSIGGPAINSVTASLLGLPYPSYGEASTIPENKALLKLIDNGDNMALAVMGWEAGDTQRACRVVADAASYDLSGNEAVVSGTSFSDISVSAPMTT